jgi:hypothetical protein
MPQKLILSAILALLLAVASVSLAFAGGGGSNGDKNGDDVRILEVTTRTLQEAEVDSPPAGDSVGDRFVFSEAVFRDGERVGMTGGDCVLVLFRPGGDPAGEPETFLAQCLATVSLPQGQITVQGLVDFARPGGGPFTLAVTGGTGAYRTAHGEVEITEESAQVDRLKFELILDED